MALSTLRSPNRLTSADIASMKGEINSTMRAYPSGYQPSIGADFNALMRVANAAVFASPWEPNDSELDEMSDLVFGMILGATVR